MRAPRSAARRNSSSEATLLVGSPRKFNDGRGWLQGRGIVGGQRRERGGNPHPHSIAGRGGAGPVHAANPRAFLAAANWATSIPCSGDRASTVAKLSGTDAPRRIDGHCPS
jgi:hypothetical protein